MNKERFAEILREYGFSEERINSWWLSRSAGPVDEARLRRSAESRRDELAESRVVVNTEQQLSQAA